MLATHGPISANAFGEKVSVAAWKNKKNYFIVADKDRMISPDLQKAFAEKINATTTIVQSSHVPILSKPKKVADIILEAALKE